MVEEKGYGVRIAAPIVLLSDAEHFGQLISTTKESAPCPEGSSRRAARHGARPMNSKSASSMANTRNGPFITMLIASHNGIIGY
jgi:hypothetical protein